MATRILVTGGAGFIGSHYVRTLLGPQGPGDVSVTVLDKLTYAGSPANLDEVRGHPHFTFRKGDICDAATVRELMAEHDQVVHFAAESHVDRSIDGGDEFIRTNVLGTHTLVNAAHSAGISTFVQISTDEVYGSIDQGSWPETHPLRPSSPYSSAKAAGDLVALSYHHTHGLDVRVTRCSNNYGHHHFPEKAIPLFITHLLDGKRIPLYGDGSHIRDWLHIDDHVQGIELVRTRGRAGEIYNIGGGTELSNRELTEMLLRELGADWDTSVQQVADRKGHDRRYSVDCTKISEELGYTPRVPFDKGLAETVQWYRDNRAWWEPLKARAAL
ncbi:dTDP-glucose 4,6-dehydratase [Streptomyces sp. 2224.1]|uniref:dTDP-glucose 4,6-dehydratase n=1 Tax=unclassified Streptomyces TaxID=2593676 RepID=UPI0008844F96|nr:MULTISPECIES: dTDP-glucose 4,6-dehydratase [unclassified Streptomyces]PBC83966.1 dTDP-glucose 4,6-dehydratase [Streptomyces sp. 2321.6]SDR36598.1 dTDP-glucose 4,6-dehydratase [Streptomyces sp. KS_16]SEB86783.1 dTDP-glucose 4,6-dehydratase [Streptomyces sp. 2224.1]SED15191.1 dTDP-glucose 4,6-dehydratase [Streptomyces sp. 2133.1]SEE64521.1 dTDP-glucose 4,6-dehydratase [Streptomyces sp. 2112.3]